MNKRRVGTFIRVLGAALGGLLLMSGPGGSARTTAAERTPAAGERVGSREFENREERYQEFLDLLRDFSGQVRPDLYFKAIADTEAMHIDAKMLRRAPAGSLALGLGGVVGVQWTQIGPQPLRIDAEQNYQGAGPDSGEVLDIAIDPRNTADNVVYIATNQGGIWRTTDGGASWRPMTDYMPSLSVGAVALDPGNPSIVYAGTGNLFDGAGVVNPTLSFNAVGLYRSTDMGETWIVLNPGNIFSGNGIHRIVFPAPGTLLVATANGLYRSIDGGFTFGNNSPTFNNNLPVRAGFITDLKLDTTAANTVHAAVNNQGIFRSTDGGATFPTNLFTSTNGAPTPGSLNFIWFDQSTAPNNQTFYASVQGSASPGTTVVTRSTDYGANWAPIADGNTRAQENNGCQCGYDQTVGVDPVDANRVYFAFQEMYCSSDGVNFGTPACTRNKIHWDHHAITFSPAGHRTGGDTTTRIWAGTDGGVSYSDDGGGNWTNVNETIASNIFLGIDIGRGSAGNNDYSYGGCQDTGTVQRQPGYAGNDWHLGVDGDGGPVAVDPTDPMTAYGSDNGCFMKTTNGGNNWGFVNAAASGLPVCSFNNNGRGVNSAIDPNDTGNIYTLSGAQIFQSTDGGSTFTSIGNFTANPTFIATTALDSNRLWVGMNDGSLRRTSNALSGAAATWSTVNVTGAPGAGVRWVAIDPSNTDQVVVVYPGFCGGGCAAGNRKRHVFRTADNGASWADISGTDGNGTSGDLPDLPVLSVAIDPGTSPHSIIVSTITKVMRTSNLGATWEVLGLGLPNVHARTVQIDPSANPTLLRVGTYGRSVFELTSATGPLLAVNGDLAFGPLCGGSSDTRVVQLFNVGSQDLHINAFFRASGSSNFQIISGPATPVTIPPGGEIDYTIQYTALVAGDQNAVFQINSDDPFQPQRSIAASGTGTTRNLVTVIADSGDFGNVCLGTFKDLDLTIQNSGGCELTINGIASTSAQFKTPQVMVFPVVIGPGASLEVPIRLEPTGLGAKAGVINITSNDPDTPVKAVAVSGNTPPGDIRVSGSTEFGDVCAGDLAEKTLSVCNVGLCNLNVASAVIDCADFTIINNPFPAPVSPDFCAPLVIRFTPTSAGPKTCNLTVSSDDPETPSVVLVLHGNTPLPEIDVPPDLAFPPEVLQDVDVCTTPLPFPVSNTGSCDLNITAYGISNNTAEYSVAGLPSFPIILEPGHIAGEGDLSLVFAPLALARARFGEVSVTYVSEPILGTLSTVHRALCGEGVRTGARVLVRQGGVPLPEVKSIKLHRINANRNGNRLDTIDQAMNLALQTVPSSAPCPAFQYHREYGTIDNPIQLLPGSYQVTVQARIDGHNLKKTVGFDVSSCDFNPTVVVDF